MMHPIRRTLHTCNRGKALMRKKPTTGPREERRKIRDDWRVLTTINRSSYHESPGCRMAISILQSAIWNIRNGAVGSSRRRKATAEKHSQLCPLHLSG